MTLNKTSLLKRKVIVRKIIIVIIINIKQLWLDVADDVRGYPFYILQASASEPSIITDDGWLTAGWLTDWMVERGKLPKEKIEKAEHFWWLLVAVTLFNYYNWNLKGVLLPSHHKDNNEKLITLTTRWHWQVGVVLLFIRFVQMNTNYCIYFVLYHSSAESTLEIREGM